jgi:plastocyanin
MRTSMGRLSGAFVLAALACACGGSGGGGNPGGPTPPTNSNVVTITASGVSPKQITVSQGARVLFINNDSRRHDVASDPHPEHTDCPAINDVGVLTAGQQRETGNLVFVNPRTCGFHDHDDPTNTRLQGQIVIR